MPNIINPNCPSLPQQVEKNTQDILKILASNLEELTGLEFNPNNLIYQSQKAVISGKFIVIRDDTSTEIDGVVSIPLIGENGIIVDASEDNLKIRIALDQSDRDLFNYVQELVNRTTESDEIIFTSDMENFVSEAIEDLILTEVIYDKYSDDININKGFTAGITNNQSIESDFSIYDYVMAFGRNASVEGFSLLIDLKSPTNSNGEYKCAVCSWVGDEGGRLRVYSASGTINAQKNRFSLYVANVNAGIDIYQNGFINKIVGVRKNG